MGNYYTIFPYQSWQLSFNEADQYADRYFKKFEKNRNLHISSAVQLVKKKK